MNNIQTYTRSVFILLLLCIFPLHAQKSIYDPMLDPDCTPIIPEEEKWSSSYMWYPGQLAVFYQQQCLILSKDRCVNVGYLGKFFVPVERTYFKKEVKLKKETAIQWAGPSAIKLYVNGELQSTPGNRITLSPGKKTLLFDVLTESRVPAIILQGKGVEEIEGWQVSLNGTYWIIPETSPMYNKPKKLPDSLQERLVEIKPREITPIRQAEVAGYQDIYMDTNGMVLVDFHHLETGYLFFRAEGAGVIEVRVGETPEEALNMNQALFEQHPIPPFELTENGDTYHVPVRAFRYAVFHTNGHAVIPYIRFYAHSWPVEYQMQFDCDDDYINNLFDMGSATLHASMNRFYLDGIKRDYLPWSMDAIVSTFAGDYLFGDQQVSKNGISIALMPYNPEPSDLGIPDYPLHALVGLKQNYLRYGDLATTLQYKDRVLQLLNFYMNMVDENGFLHGKDGEFGFTPGWATKNGPESKGVPAYAQIMLYHNYMLGAWFADLWKEKAWAKACRYRAEQLKTNILTSFWDDDRKAFINGFSETGQPDTRISHHAQYWAILADLFPEEYYDHLFENVFPNIPFYYEDISYEKGYEFLAYVKAGRIKEMWDFIDHVFGDWMKQGHTRFPENFSPGASKEKQLEFYGRPYGLSLCHGANGAPPVVGVLNGLIGFSQSDTKPNEYTIRPEMLHLNRIHARIPVKEGYITLRLYKDKACEMEIPKGCTVKVITKDTGKPLVWKKQGVYTFNL
ncbi:MAG: glycoside hydrolase [Candidatus Azobacteroides sp.]|nr:glycoside hydrolase [Candidatus Azobacteroides sp.]